MKRGAFYLVFYILFAVTVITASIDYNGRIDSTNGIHNVEFKLYTSQKSVYHIWSETHENIEFRNGNYSVELGSVNPMVTLDSETDYFIEVIIDGENIRRSIFVYSSPIVFARELSAPDSDSGVILEEMAPTIEIGDQVDDVIVPSGTDFGIGLAPGTDASSRFEVQGGAGRFWDGSASIGYAIGEGDLYVEDQLEVDNTIYASHYRDNANGNLINGGSGINVSEDVDGSWTITNTAPGTDDQNLSLSGTNLNIEDGSGVSLASFMDNTDTQDLSIVDHTIFLVDGGSVTVPDNYNADNAPTATVRGEPTRAEIEAWADGVDDDHYADALTVSGTTTKTIVLERSGGLSDLTATFTDLIASGGDSDWTVSGTNQYSAVSGNVGIGTTSPGTKLEVNGNISVPSGDGYRFITGGTGWEWGIGRNLITSTADGIDIVGYSGNFQVIDVDGTSGSYTYDTYLDINMSSGLVTVGNTVVEGDLSVDGMYMDSDGDSGISGQVLTSTGLGTNWAAASGGDSDWTVSGTNQYSAVSGNVGIGTSSPTRKLQVTIPGAGDIASFHAYNNVNPCVTIGDDNSAPGVGFLSLEVASSGTETVKLTASSGHPSYFNAGNVGVNTTTPAYNLEVNGTFQADNVRSGTFDLPIADGASGQFLSYNGTWATPASSGDITSVTAGNDLDGGGTSGAVTLSIEPTLNYVSDMNFDSYISDQARLKAGSGSPLAGRTFSDFGYPGGEGIWLSVGSSSDEGGIFITESGIIVQGDGDNDLMRIYDDDIGATRYTFTSYDGILPGADNTLDLGSSAYSWQDIFIDGNVYIDGSAGTAGQVLTSNGTSGAYWSTPSTGLTGSGTSGRNARWTGTTTLGNSAMYDNGAQISVGTSVNTDYQIYGYETESGDMAVYGRNAYSTDHYGYLGGSDYGVYGSYDGGNSGYIGGTSYGVYGRHSSGNYGYIGSSSYALYGSGTYGIYAYGSSYAGYFSGNVRITGRLYDSSGDVGSSGQVLTSTGSGTNWSTPSGGSSYWTDAGTYLNPNGGIGSYLRIADTRTYMYGFYSDMASTSNSYGIYARGEYTGTSNPAYTYGGYFISDGDYQDGYGVRIYRYGRTSTNYGVYSYVSRTSGTYNAMGGYFSNSAGGYAYVGSYYSGSTRKIYGSGAVSEIIPTEDHGRITLTCPESPEYWYQDYGHSTTTNGFATIELDPILLDITIIDEDNPIKVLVSEQSDRPVAKKITQTQSGFEIRFTDSDGLPYNDEVEFDYMVVLRPKTLYGEGRFPQAPPPGFLTPETDVPQAKAANVPKEGSIYNWPHDWQVYNYEPGDFIKVGAVVEGGPHDGMIKIAEGEYMDRREYHKSIGDSNNEPAYYDVDGNQIPPEWLEELRANGVEMYSYDEMMERRKAAYIKKAKSMSNCSNVIAN